MTSDKAPRRQTHSALIIATLIGAVAVAAAGAVVVSAGTKQSNNTFASATVVDAFRAAGVRLTLEGRPASKTLPVTFFSPELKSYVLVWPDAASRRRIEQANGPTSSAVTKLELGNVEVDLPARATRAKTFAQRALDHLRSTSA